MGKQGADFIYLAPHLDDAAYSCGGLIHQQTASGAAVEVWTVCAGDPPPGAPSRLAEELLERWGVGADAVAVRRAEDETACDILGAEPVHLTVPDAIFRRSADGVPLYRKGEALFASMHLDDAPRVDALELLLRARLPADTVLVCPLTIGNHVDHRLTRAAVERLGLQPWFYLDFPYVLQQQVDPDLLPEGYTLRVVPLGHEDQAAWARAIAAYASQLSSFWQDAAQMQAQLAEFVADVGGMRLAVPEE